MKLLFLPNGKHILPNLYTGDLRRRTTCSLDPIGMEGRAFKYIGGIFRNKKQKLIAVGGVEDHIHLLFGLRPSIAISDLIRDVKSDSTEFINKKRFSRRTFRWQEGFGAFSYSRSQLDSVAKYVLEQEKHHSKRSFKNEYVALLGHFEVEYDERYLFKWIE